MEDDPNFPALATERLRLRRLIPGDAPALLQIHGDADAMRWYGTDPLPDLAAAAKLVDAFDSWRRMPNPGTRWGIERQADGLLVGTCGLFKWNRNWRSCALGYELGREAWGAGYMHEALSAILAWGFEHMGLNRIEAQIHPQNQPSLRLAERLGFVLEGRLRECGHWLGQYHDLLHYSLLQRDHAARISA